MKWAIAVIFCVLSVFVALVCGSCASREARMLETVNVLSDIDNDSAVKILNSIDTTRLNVREKAYRELLRVRFHYLRAGDPSFPDTLPQWVQREMLINGNSDNVFDVHFWNSTLYVNQGKFILAMLEAEMGRNALPATTYSDRDKAILEAHIDRTVANIWLYAGENDLAISYLKKADDGYSKATGTEYVVENQFNKMQLAEEMAQMGSDEQAFTLLDAVKPLDNKIYHEIQRLKLTSLIKTGQYDQAREIAVGLLSAGVDSLLLMPAMAEIAIHDGNIKLAKKYADKFCANGVLTLQIIKIYEQIAEGEGDLALALKIQKEISELSQIRHGSIISGVELKEALDRQNSQILNKNRRKAERSRNEAIIVICLSLVIIVLVVGWTFTIIRKKKARMDNLVMAIEELRIRDNEKNSRISGLLAQRFESMNRLCDEYFNVSDLTNENLAKNEIYKTLVAQLKEMGGEKFRKRLEESLNENMDNIMDRFRETFPGDNEGAMLFLYFGSGFSARAVGIFTGLKKSSVYSRRRQLKQNIEKSETPYKEKFLSLIN